MLVELRAYQAEGEFGTPYRDVDLPEDVGQRADVILMAVGKQDALDLVGVLKEIGHVGDDDVHPQHILIWKHEAAVYDQDLAAELQGGHVLADLGDAPQGDDAE